MEHAPEGGRQDNISNELSGRQGRGQELAAGTSNINGGASGMVGGSRHDGMGRRIEGKHVSSWSHVLTMGQANKVIIMEAIADH
jgi:hypothetical protein